MSASGTEDVSANRWDFRGTASFAVASAMIPSAGPMFAQAFTTMRDFGFGQSGAYAVALALPAATITVVSVSAGKAAVMGRDAGVRAYASTASKVRTAVDEARGFFDSERIRRRHRRMVVTMDDAFGKALSSSLELSGKAHMVHRDAAATTFHADARDIDPLVETLVRMEGLDDVDVTVVAVRPLGPDAPSVVRSLRDGTSVALWASEDGRPERAVGYATDGSPAWVRRMDRTVVDRTAATLFDEPDLRTAVSTMAVLSSDIVETHGASLDAMRSTLDEDTHVMVEDRGFVRMLDRRGRLDNPHGGPAMLSPWGRETWAIAGKEIEVLESEVRRHRNQAMGNGMRP